MKRILVTSTDVMMYLFLVPHIKKLKSLGFTVDIACSFADEYHNHNYLSKVKSLVHPDAKIYKLNSVRSPFSLKNIPTIIQLKKIIKKGDYNLIWCNEPVIGFVSRLAAQNFRKKNGLKILYLVHGLHFFKGSPLLNWFFYPIEKILSYFTDLTVTINNVDTIFIKKHFGSPVAYLKGIGFQHSKYSNLVINRNLKRKELGFLDNDIIILCVGELLPRKNHEVAIKVFSKLDNMRCKLVICGIGGLKDRLLHLAKSLKVSGRVFFLGQRNDVNEILKASDIFFHPSLREGLGMAPLEAMAAGLPIVTSNAQGIVDYSINNVTGFVCDPNDTTCYVDAMSRLSFSSNLRNSFSQNNVNLSSNFDINNSTSSFASIVTNLLKK